MKQPEEVNWISVLNFLQKEQTKSTIREKQWNLQRYQLMQKINRLQAQLDTNKILINDLLNRIKLLQIALFESKSINPSIKPSVRQQENQGQKIQSLLQKYRIQNRVKQGDNKTFLNEILSQIGIDSAEVFPQKQQQIQGKINIFQNRQGFEYKQANSINAHLDGIRKIFINELKDFIITVSQDCLVKVWPYASITKGKVEHLDPSKSYRQHTGPLFALSGGSSPFNPQQSIFFTGGNEGLIKYWRINNKNFGDSAQAICTWSTSKAQNGLVVWDLALNKNKLLSSGSDGYLNLYEITQNEGNNLKLQFKQKQFNATCVHWISQQTFVHGCSNVPRAQVWDLTGKARDKYYYETPKGAQNENHQINQICYSSNLKMLSMGCEDGCVRLFSINFNRMIKKIQMKSSVSTVKVVKDWQISCGTQAGSLTLWDLRTYQKIQQFQKIHTTKYDEGILCQWTEPNKIFTGGADGTIKLLS